MERSLSVCLSGGGSSFLWSPVLNGGGQPLLDLFKCGVVGGVFVVVVIGVVCMWR